MHFGSNHLLLSNYRYFVWLGVVIQNCMSLSEPYIPYIQFRFVINSFKTLVTNVTTAHYEQYIFQTTEFNVIKVDIRWTFIRDNFWSKNNRSKMSDMSKIVQHMQSTKHVSEATLWGCFSFLETWDHYLYVLVRLKSIIN